MATAPLVPTLPGVTADFHAHVYTTPVEKTEYLALALGDVGSARAGAGARADRLLPRRRLRLGGVRLRRAARRRRCRRSSARGAASCSTCIPSGRHSLLGDFEAHVLHEESARVAGREHKLRDFGLGAQVLAAARRAQACAC